MKKTKTSKQPPSQLLQDNDGHWYLVPESEIVRFEQALSLMGVANRPDANDETHDAACAVFAPFERMRIDGPHSIRILKWQEI
jgi:hypothetical protein